MALESESQSLPDEVSLNHMFDIGCEGSGGSGNKRGSATLTVITNHENDFSPEDQENEQPAPMNWDNLNRILRDIELELQQKDFGNPLKHRKHQVSMPLSPLSLSREKIDVLNNDNLITNNSSKKIPSPGSPTHHGTNLTSYQNEQILEQKSKEMEMKGIIKSAAGSLVVTESHGTKVAANNPTSSLLSSTMTTMQTQRDTTSTSPRPVFGNQHSEFHHEQLKTKGREYSTVKIGSTNKTAGGITIAYEEDEDKERAVNALIKRMFEELAAEMMEEILLDQEGKGINTHEQGAAMDDDDDGDNGGIDKEVRDSSDTALEDSAVTSSERDRNEETINQMRDGISTVNDDDHEDIFSIEKEVVADEQRDTDDSNERTRKALEFAAIAATAELERRRKEDEEIRRRQEEEKKRMRAEEQKRKDQTALVKTILHANCGNETNAYYKVLGVLPTCSTANIKKAYRKLALKLHPDKEKYNTPKADEAFKAVSHAYDVLKDEAMRNEYDRIHKISATSPDALARMSNNGPKIPIIIPSGSRITIQSKDIRFAHFNGLRGCVVSYDDSTDLYTIQIDDHCTTMKSKITALFRNIIVCLRAAKANELGVFVVTLVSYYKDDRGGLFQARYNGEGGKRGSVYLRSEQFIVPNGTVVGLQCGNYGTIVDWQETIDQYTRADTSYYKVRLYNDIFTRVPMKNIRL